MLLLAVVREDAVKLSTINVEKRTELCFSFLIPSSEFIFSCNNVLLLCTWAINPSRKYPFHDLQLTNHKLGNYNYDTVMITMNFYFPGYLWP